MDDDSKNPSGQPGVKPAVTVEFVKNHFSGGLIKQERLATGQFKRQKRSLATAKQRREIIQNILSSPEVGPDGKMKRGDRTIHQRIIENIARNAMISAEQPVFDKFGNLVLRADGSPLTIADPKVMAAAAMNFKELYLRADGKYATSDEDLEAQKLHGIKIMVITPPPEMLNREVVENKPLEKLEPKFIEGEFKDDKN